MSKRSSAPSDNQFDPKIFKESLGSFGTTTRPGGNQLQELQTKVRQGVKHVELHLNQTGKGEFGAQDTPDKYGSENRRAIMQLAKLNNQSLSVHATLNVVSFSGISQGGINEAQRINAIKEVDETLKFASETAKGGAVVMHMQGEGLTANPTNLSLSQKYIDWLENKAKSDDYYKNELKELQDNYFVSNPQKRRFADNIDLSIEIRKEFNELESKDKRLYDQVVARAKANGKDPWEEYYEEKILDNAALNPEVQPLVMVGDQIGQVQRKQTPLASTVFEKGTLEKNLKLTNEEKEFLMKKGIDASRGVSLTSAQKLNALFSTVVYNGNKKDKETFEKLKKRVVVNYRDVLEEKNNLIGQADKEFYIQQQSFQKGLLTLQKRNLETKHAMYEKQLRPIKKMDAEAERLQQQLEEYEQDSDIDKAAKSVVAAKIADINRRKLGLVQQIGQQEYYELQRFDEQVSQINQQLEEIERQTRNVKAVTDETFEKNVAGLAHLGVNALKYQLELKNKAMNAQESRKKEEKKLEELEAKYHEVESIEEKYDIDSQIARQKKEVDKWVGLNDYKDIDVETNPLYIAPENMLPNMGSLTTIEDFKATIRMAQEEFAQKILSKEKQYQKVKELYEQETGKKITTHKEAMELARKHVSGTWDNAHAGAWFKHFRKESPDESDEHRMERFNQWVNTQAEEMYKEGIIKHVHFNDTIGKDDDHNLVGMGFLDVHDLRNRLRKAGFKESFIVEAGGRGAADAFQITNVWDQFNVSLFNAKDVPEAQLARDGAVVSDWMSAKREYQKRPQYSEYGMTRGFTQPTEQQRRGGGSWSGSSFYN